MIVQLILVGIAAFAFIGLRAAQTLHIIRKAYLWIMLTSLLIEVAGVFYIVTVARLGYAWYVVLSTGLGGGLGVVFFTWLNHRSKRG